MILEYIAFKQFSEHIHHHHHYVCVCVFIWMNLTVDVKS